MSKPLLIYVFIFNLVEMIEENSSSGGGGRSGREMMLQKKQSNAERTHGAARAREEDKVISF